MVIVNDHDPRPLKYQFAAERPDLFDWTYVAEGPEVWRVRIDRRWPGRGGENSMTRRFHDGAPRTGWRRR
jgi:uncharacterized protein (DUF2249 family)